MNTVSVHARALWLKRDAGGAFCTHGSSNPSESLARLYLMLNAQSSPAGLVVDHDMHRLLPGGGCPPLRCPDERGACLREVEDCRCTMFPDSYPQCKVNATAPAQVSTTYLDPTAGVLRAQDRDVSIQHVMCVWVYL